MIFFDSYILANSEILKLSFTLILQPTISYLCFNLQIAVTQKTINTNNNEKITAQIVKARLRLLSY